MRFFDLTPPSLFSSYIDTHQISTDIGSDFTIGLCIQYPSPTVKKNLISLRGSTVCGDRASFLPIGQKELLETLEVVGVEHIHSGGE